MNIQRVIYYRAQHVTGPSCVHVSIRFGETPNDGPLIVRLLAKDKADSTVQFDLENHVGEILSGVEKANVEYEGSLQVEEIEVVPDDYPRKSQAEYVAYKIASAILCNEI